MQSDRPYAGTTQTNGQTGSSHAQASGSSGDEVDLGVKLGYEVIDEYLEQAKSMAGQFSPDLGSKFGNMNGLPGGMEKLADESMSYYRQLIDTWMRMVSSIGQQMLTPASGQGSGGLWGMDGQNANAANTAATPETSEQSGPMPGAWQEVPLTNTPPVHANVALSVNATQPASVSFELKPGYDPMSMLVQPLRSLDIDAPTIGDVGFRPEGDGVALHVTVPDGLPVGVYSGAIVNAATGSAAGTVSVTVKPRTG